jgi:hypothetical protein
LLSVTDKNNTSSPIKIFSSPSDIANFSGIQTAPTLKLFKNSVRTGDFLRLEGYALAGSTITAEVDGVLQAETAVAESDGSYRLLISTAKLSIGTHSVNVQSSSSGVKSEPSILRSFRVADIFQTGVDFNDDGQVDVRDVNIFLSNWISSNYDVKIKDDLNGDGNTDIQDLSIFAQSVGAR